MGVSKLRPRNFRLQTSDLETSDSLKNDWNYMNEYLFIIIVTNPKCQIMQQSRIDKILQTGKRFLIFLFKTKTRTTITMAKLFHFLACNLWKRPELPGKCNNRCHTYEPLGNINNLYQIFLMYDTSLDQTMTQMNSKST